ncbi:hypothetical protein BDR05DRAFT_1063436 [Suillus weaverae]|nr:hypothetical protein BDR05DRAFT_1063436 [Suillus weaverae]
MDTLGPKSGAESGAISIICQPPPPSTDLDISSLLTSLQGHPTLARISLVDLVSFMRHLHLLKDDILQPQPHNVSIMHAPDVLLQSIVGFLVASLNLLPNVVDALWSIMKDLVWVMPSSAEMDASDEAAFRVHPVF